MAEHTIIGKEGEDIALNYLKKLGYFILHTNWRAHHLEIDIIAEKENIIHFVEVKARKKNSLLQAREALSYKKKNNLERAVEFYYHKHQDCKKSAQLDLIALSYTNTNGKREYEIEYFPNYTQN